jgi:hypothetical protein
MRILHRGDEKASCTAANLDARQKRVLVACGSAVRNAILPPGGEVTVARTRRNVVEVEREGEAAARNWDGLGQLREAGREL